MDSTPFSSKTVKMLEDNEFAISWSKPFLSFKKVSLSKAMLLVPAFFLTLIAVVHIQQHPIKTLAAILVISLFTKALWIRLTKQLHFQIDFSDHTFKFYDQKKNLHWHFLHEVSEISWKSKFVSEYTSACKNTSEEHEITIRMKMSDNKLLNIFKFSSDYAEPTPEIAEIYSFLENVIKKIKII